MGGRIGFPLYTLYNSTKWAVEGLFGGVAVRAKAAEHQGQSDRAGRHQDGLLRPLIGYSGQHSLYGSVRQHSERGQGRFETAMRTGSAPRVVAQAIYQAATDASWRLRYPVGSDAWLVSLLRRLLPAGLFYRC